MQKNIFSTKFTTSAGHCSFNKIINLHHLYIKNTSINKSHTVLTKIEFFMFNYIIIIIINPPHNTEIKIHL